MLRGVTPSAPLKEGQPKKCPPMTAYYIINTWLFAKKMTKIIQYLLNGKHFSESQFFRHIVQFGLGILFGPTISVDQKFLEPIFFRTHNFFGPNYCLRLGDFHWRRGVKPFRAEHFQLKSCIRKFYKSVNFQKNSQFFS